MIFGPWKNKVIKWGFVVTPCANLFWVVVVLKKCFDQYAQIVFRSRNIRAVQIDFSGYSIQRAIYIDYSANLLCVLKPPWVQTCWCVGVCAYVRNCLFAYVRATKTGSSTWLTTTKSIRAFQPRHTCVWRSQFVRSSVDCAFTFAAFFGSMTHRKGLSCK